MISGLLEENKLLREIIKEVALDEWMSGKPPTNEDIERWLTTMRADASSQTQEEESSTPESEHATDSERDTHRSSDESDTKPAVHLI